MIPITKYKKPLLYLYILLFIVIILSREILSGSTLEYRVVRPGLSDEIIVVDPNESSLLNISGFKVPIKYSNAIDLFSRNIVNYCTQTIALEQKNNSSEVVLSKYIAKYLLIVIDNTFYELYYDSNTEILVYGLIKQNNLEYEVFLRTFVNNKTPPQTHEYRDKELESLEYFENKSSIKSRGLYINVLIAVLIVIVFPITLFVIVKILLKKRW